jgi:hypothetical protein
MSWYKKIKLAFNQGDPVRFVNPLNGQETSGVFDAIFESGINQGKARVRIGNAMGRPLAIPIESVSLISTELQPGQIVNLPNYPTESPAKIVKNLGNNQYEVLPRSNRSMTLPISEISF